MSGAWICALVILCFGPPLDDEYGDDTDSIRKAAFELYNEGKVEKALDLFEKSLSRVPDDAAVLQTVGFILYRAEEFDQAENHFLRAVAAEGETGYSLFMLGNIAFRRFRLAEARRYYEKVGALQPDYPLLEMNVSLLIQRIARVEELKTLRKRCDRFYWGAITAVALLLLLFVAFETVQAGRDSPRRDR